MDEELPPNKQITTLHTYDTEYSADSVEWCPHEPHQDILVCANYQLLEGTKTDKCNRTGRILLFSVNETELKLLQTLDTPAVLDQKWCHIKINNFSVLGVCNALKTLEIYKLNDCLKLEKITECKVDSEESETLVLSLDWSTGKYENDTQIVCSDSKGRVHLFRFHGDELILETSFKGHDYEAWITCFDYWNTNVFFSGGDDCKFLQFDKRSGTSAVVTNSKTHEAGVTSMHSNAEQEHILATGSYDSMVQIWDTRSLKTPKTTIKTPGTLWRLKWDPFQHKFLLSACMLGGLHILNPTTIEDSYYEHKNIVYGADWCHSPKTSLASCSFYDHLLCISQIKLF